MPDRDSEVVVIGGGAAGVAATRRLHDAGVPCLLVEARRRLGGRAWTVSGPSGAALDLGCGWLHSADRNPWSEIAAAQGRAIDKTPPPWTRPSLPFGFPVTAQREAFAALQAFYGRVHADENDRADEAAVVRLEPGNRWNGLIRSILTYVSGAELEQLSVRDLAGYEDSGINWRVVDGYGTTVAAHGADLPVVFDCPVTRIDHSGKRLRIETAKGTIIAAQAIVALPTTLLATEQVAFVPSLAAKVDAAARLPLGLADKLFLSLDAAEEFEKDSRLFGRTDRAGTGAYHFRPFGRPLIEAYFGGALADDLEAAGEGAFFELARTELVGLLGSDFASRIKPLQAHGWRRDPFARGSYSFALPGAAPCRAALAAPVEGRLFFAGEACSATDYSTAHGAWTTGTEAAEAVIAARRRRPR
jgi:monoamine oxidase